MWLPQVTRSRIVSPPSIQPSNSRVCDLLDHDSLLWNKDLIEKEFLPHEAKLIQGLPLSVQLIPDKEVWLPMSHGDYTTHSAYQLMMKIKSDNQPSCSS